MGNTLPYYPMYVFDFDEDPCVLGMNLSEVGLYVLALNEAWKRGSIPDDPTALASLIRRKPAEVKKAWLKVRSCWTESGTPGKLINPRQEKERKVSTEKSATASASSRKRWESASVSSLKEDANAYASVSESESKSESRFEISTQEGTTSRARVEPATGLRLWCDHRGFKKPARSMRVRILDRIKELDITEAEFSAALDGYYASEWGRKNGYPVFGFLKNPESWIPVDCAAPEETFAPPVDLPPITIAPVAPRAAYEDSGDMWNRINPDDPCLKDRYYPASRVRECEADAMYMDRREESMLIGNKIRAGRQNSGWVNYSWFVSQGKDGKPPGWYRLLTEFRWMADYTTPRKSKESDAYEEALRSLKYDREANATH